jgi:hypothetical protein
MRDERSRATGFGIRDSGLAGQRAKGSTVVNRCPGAQSSANVLAMAPRGRNSLQQAASAPKKMKKGVKQPKEVIYNHSVNP